MIRGFRGPQGDRPLNAFDGLCRLSLLLGRNTPEMPRIGMIRIRGDDLPVQLRRLCDAARAMMAGRRGKHLLKS